MIEETKDHRDASNPIMNDISPPTGAATAESTTSRTATPRVLWDRSPASWKAAAVVALVGFVFKLGGSTKRTINGVVESCDGLDLAPFLIAGAVAVLTFVGYRTLQGRHPARRLSRSATLGALGVLLALAAVHLGRGLLDPSGSFC